MNRSKWRSVAEELRSSAFGIAGIVILILFTVAAALAFLSRTIRTRSMRSND